MRNLAEDLAHTNARERLESRLLDWMSETDDPLLDGPVVAPPGAVVNDPTGISAKEPFLEAVDY